MLKHGQVSNVDVVAGETTNVSLDLTPISAEFSTPESVMSGDPFTVGLTRVFPLRAFANFRASQTPIIDESYAAFNVSSSGNFTINAPSVETDDVVYLQVLMFIDPVLVGTDESFAAWTFYYPNITQGDAQYTVPIRPAEGGIGIVVNY